EPVHQAAEEANAALDILVRVEHVLDLEARGHSRHQLHQAAGAPARHRPRVELGLDLDDRAHQAWGATVADGDHPQAGLDLIGALPMVHISRHGWPWMSRCNQSAMARLLGLRYASWLSWRSVRQQVSRCTASRLRRIVASRTSLRAPSGTSEQAVPATTTPPP